MVLGFLLASHVERVGNPFLRTFFPKQRKHVGVLTSSLKDIYLATHTPAALVDALGT